MQHQRVIQRTGHEPPVAVHEGLERANQLSARVVGGLPRGVEQYIRMQTKRADAAVAGKQVHRQQINLRLHIMHLLLLGLDRIVQKMTVKRLLLRLATALLLLLRVTLVHLAVGLLLVMVGLAEWLLVRLALEEYVPRVVTHLNVVS